MPALLRAYRYLNILSIDTALGAVVSALFFARLIDAEVWIYGKIALGVTVWIIYTADHLLDAKKVKGIASSERHRFHQRHFRVLFLLMVAAALVNLIVVFYMRTSLLLYGMALSVVVALYLVISRYLKMLKEVFIALIYTLGVMLPGLADSKNLFDWADQLFMFNFFLIAVANLLIFSLFDVQKDRADGHHSFVTFYGKEKTRAVVYGLFVALIVITTLLGVFWSYEVLPLAVLLLMMVILMIILVRENAFAEEDRFRFVGDAIFFLPGIYVLIEHLRI